MDILYVSALCSENFLDEIYTKTQNRPLQSIQKFHRLLIEGISKVCRSVETLSIIPFSQEISHSKIYKRTAETEKNIKYRYVPFYNLGITKHLFTFIYSFLYTLRWCLKHKKGIIIADVLNVSVCFGALAASKIIRNTSVAIVTDMPGMIVGKTSKIAKIANWLTGKYINSFSKYILLTEQMNEKVNIRRRPYIVMEGLVDKNIRVCNDYKQKGKKILMYAGGLYEQYGVKLLIDAFDNISKQFPNTRLDIYGYGNLTDYITKIEQKNPQIKFYGVRHNDEIVNAEVRSVLLINPRPIHEEFTKYSFPSKNMEYMVSGTATLTTKLPGMPQEYYEYVYMFDDISLHGFEQKLSEILSLPISDLRIKGESARRFVLENKNNYVQGEKVVSFIRN